MYKNLYYNDDFIFNTTLSGVTIYDMSLNPLGEFLIDSLSCVYADSTNLYLATTNSGILYSPISSIAMGIFDDFHIYKQYPDITSNNTKYIHGAGDYLLVTTESGIDQLNTITYDRVYNESSKTLSKCFQTTAGRFYYVSNDTTEVFFSLGTYKSIITLSEETSIPNFQIKITLTAATFDYSKCTSTGKDLLFFDSNQVELPYYIETWVYNGTSVIWVKVGSAGIPYLYMIYGDADAISKSNPLTVFDLYDNFTYPIAVVGSNLFSPTYGAITTVGTTHPEYLYDGNISLYYDYSFKYSGDYIQIAFFVPKVIRQIKIWHTGYGNDTSVYVCASNTGSFSGEEVLLYNIVRENIPSITTFTFFLSEPYIYYRIVRGAGDGGTAWQLQEINMYEITSTDITTISGSPWVYATDPEKFIIMSSSVMSCNLANNDYIRTDYLFEPPVIVEQRVKLNRGQSGKIAYSIGIEPSLDGVNWYPAGNQTFVPVFNGTVGAATATSSHAMPTSWGVLEVISAPGVIKANYIGTSSFYTYWVGGTHGGKNRALRICGGDYESDISIDWIRVRKYDATPPSIIGISSPMLLEYTYELNVVYDNSINWVDSSVGYSYSVDDSVVINDIFVTEGTSTYSVTDNVIFIATTDGLVVLEERRGDETNSRIKYFKAKGNV